MRRLLAVSMLAGCSFSIAAEPVPDDGRSDSAGGEAADAAFDAPTPDAAPLGVWGAPQRISELSTSDGEDDPSLTSDLLEIYFGSTRPGTLGNEDLWMASRPTSSAPFGTPVHLAALSSPDSDSNVKVSASGLAITFASARAPTAGDTDLWISTRPSRASPWSAPTRVIELASPQGDWAAYPQDDLLQLVFCSNRDGDEDLYRATRPSTSAMWGAPIQLTTTSTAQSECDPMDPDASTIYFSSTRAGGIGDYDLYVAARAGAGYASATPLTTLNTTSRDRDPWVSPDQRVIVFSSDRMGTDDLYISTR